MQKNDNNKLPYYTVLFRQFPYSIEQVVTRSVIGHEKYHATDQNWDNFKTVDPERYLNAAIRHLINPMDIDEDAPQYNTEHIAAAIWNLLAYLQVQHELRNNNEPIPSIEGSAGKDL